MIKLKSILLENMSADDLGRLFQYAYSAIFDMDVNEFKVVRTNVLTRPAAYIHQSFNIKISFQYKMKSYFVTNTFFYFVVPKEKISGFKGPAWVRFLEKIRTVPTKTITKEDLRKESPLFGFQAGIDEGDSPNFFSRDRIGDVEHAKSIKQLVEEVKAILDKPDGSSGGDAPADPTPTPDDDTLVPMRENDDEEDEENEGVDENKLFNSDSYLDDVAEQLGWKENFSESFWQYPQILYHCTTPENVESIQTKGLSRKSETRGLTNRHTPPAIFTTVELDEVPHLQSYYGTSVFKINTQLMKQEGYMPEVSKEPEWERAHKLSFVFQKLGKKEEHTYPERFVDSSDGVSDYTVIIHGNIPPKYLSLME